jgi:hypothetical protein
MDLLMVDRKCFTKIVLDPIVCSWVINKFLEEPGELLDLDHSADVPLLL